MKSVTLKSLMINAVLSETENLSLAGVVPGGFSEEMMAGLNSER